MKKIINSIQDINIALFIVCILFIIISLSIFSSKMIDKSNVVIESDTVHREIFEFHPTTKDHFRLNLLIVAEFKSNNDSVRYYKSVIKYNLANISAKTSMKNIGLLKGLLYDSLAKTNKFYFIGVLPNDERTEELFFKCGK